MTYTKIDNRIIGLAATSDPRQLILYMAILSVKREGIPLCMTDKELIELSGIGKNEGSRCLKGLEASGLIVRDGKSIIDVAHPPYSLNGNYTLIENDFIAKKIDARTKLIYLKLVSLKQDAWGYVRISQDTLKHSIGLKARTNVYRHIKKLQDLGYILDVQRGEGFNPSNHYKVKKVDQSATDEALRQKKADKQKEKYRHLKEKIGTGSGLSVDELWELFRCLVNERGEIYNAHNKKKDMGVLRHLLKTMDSNVLARMIEIYVECFDRRYRNYEQRRTIKLHFLGDDDVFNGVKSSYELETSQESIIDNTESF